MTDLTFIDNSSPCFSVFYYFNLFPPDALLGRHHLHGCLCHWKLSLQLQAFTRLSLQQPEGQCLFWVWNSCSTTKDKEMTSHMTHFFGAVIYRIQIYWLSGKTSRFLKRLSPKGSGAMFNGNFR